ncbi:MAG TPA: hypothetical protein DEO84_06990 [candidate division Zixibacteria bacterium]|nr:hypothetical protein [candidate division Zixibacteria bacterium]
MRNLNKCSNTFKLKITPIQILIKMLIMAFCSIVILGSSCPPCDCPDCPNPNPIVPDSTGVTLFNDHFGDYTGWTYTTDNNPGASFGTSNSLISVANFGDQQSGFYGPIAVKTLDQPININADDFALSAYIIANDGDMNKRGEIHITIADADNVPIVGIYWYHYYSNLNNSYLGLYSEGEIVGMHGAQTIFGKVTLKKSLGQLSLHFNDGPQLVTTTINTTRIATKVRLEILKYDNRTARDMQIDWIRVTTP